MFDEILRDHIICIEPNPMDPVPPWHIWKERKLREIEAQALKGVMPIPSERRG